MQAVSSLGARIREARHSKGWTQAQLASAVNTRERNIIRWENDQHEPRMKHVSAIATATGRDLDFFLSESAESVDDDSEAAEPVGKALEELFATLLDRAVDRAVHAHLTRRSAT